MREDIDLLLMKSNYIFSTLCIQRFLQCHIRPYCVHSVSAIQYNREILHGDCPRLVQPVREKALNGVSHLAQHELA